MKAISLDGRGRFRIYDRESNKLLYEMDPDQFLISNQFGLCLRHPHLLLQVVRQLEEKLKGDGVENVKITGKFGITYNGRPVAELIDDSCDLTREPYRLFSSYPWILK